MKPLLALTAGTIMDLELPTMRRTQKNCHSLFCLAVMERSILPISEFLLRNYCNTEAYSEDYQWQFFNITITQEQCYQKTHQKKLQG
jgi:hypothetical protein